MFVDINNASKLQEKYSETWVFVMFQGSGRQRKYIRVYRIQWRKYAAPIHNELTM